MTFPATTDGGARRQGGVTEQSGWIENRASHGFRLAGLRELWHYRELAGFLALRDIKVRYKQAIFGVAWAVLQPLAGVIVFTIVFRRLAKIPSEGIPYPVFAFVGLSVWAYVSGATTKATQSLVSNVTLVTKVYFPRLLAPMALVLPGLLDLVLSLLVLIVLLPVYNVSPGWAILTTPLWLIALVALPLAVGLWLGTLNVAYRDINQVITLLVQLWLFVSPVAYPSSLVTGPLRWLYAINPAVGVLDGLRWALIGAPLSSASTVVSLTVLSVLLVGGVAYFQRSERRFADVI